MTGPDPQPDAAGEASTAVAESAAPVTTVADARNCPALLATAGPAAVAAWEGFVSNEHFAPTSRQINRQIAARFLNWLEGRGGELTQVTPALVQDFLDARDLLATTKYHYRRALNLLFDSLVTHGALPGNPLTESLANQFARFTPVERQATVDAASVALTMHEIHLFTGGTGGGEADVERCEEALRLGEQYGITPLSWVEDADALPAHRCAAADAPGCESSPPTDER